VLFVPPFEHIVRCFSLAACSVARSAAASADRRSIGARVGRHEPVIRIPAGKSD
jgi:hypothetical protein